VKSWLSLNEVFSPPNRRLAEFLFKVPNLPEKEEQNGSDLFGDEWLTVEETVGYQRDRKEPENQAHQSVESDLFFQGRNRHKLHFLLPLILGARCRAAESIKIPRANQAKRIPFLTHFIKKNLYS
jgi:hypothetical protein